MNDYIMSVRSIENNNFTGNVGNTSFLSILDTISSPSQSDIISADKWYKLVKKDSVWYNDKNEERGDILFIVHGYNTSAVDVLARHRSIKNNLLNEGFKGVVVSFDWPSDNNVLAYLPDRHKAKETALKLVTDGITYLSGQQTPTCSINIHVLGHSTGAFVIREAFDDADDSNLPNSSWNVSQVIFAAGDVSSDSMSIDDGGADSIYRHCVRLTNYSNRHDLALDLSNVKRMGTAPRVGRIGLPENITNSAVNVDCTEYYEQLTSDPSSIISKDQPSGITGMKSHCWYFGNRIFTKDLFNTIIGIDRDVILTRTIGIDGKLKLLHI